jgi:hypothetical protein
MGGGSGPVGGDLIGSGRMGSILLVFTPTTAESRPPNRGLWYCGVIEPNAWGAHQIRAARWQALNDSGWRPTPP